MRAIYSRFGRLLTLMIMPIFETLRFIRYLSLRFIEDKCSKTAAALTYTSLLSLVPLLAVGFAILAAFPVFKSVGKEIQDFIFVNFVPTSQEMIQEYLLNFVDKASDLTIVGIIFLFVTALLLMETIEQALNDIWRVRKRRKGVAEFTVYWAVLSLGPLLLGISLAVTSYVLSLPLVSIVKQPLLTIMPFVLTMLAFTLIYVVIPDRHVPIRHGLLGGFIAALLFEIAKKSFALYVKHFPTYELVYGALATIPIFLIWVYLSWFIILLGAEITCSLTSFYRREEKAIPALPNHALVKSFRLIGHLWQAQTKGESLSFEDLLHLEDRLSETNVETLLNHLIQIKWVHYTENGQYALSRDIHQITLLDLYQTLSSSLLEPTKNWRTDDYWETSLNDILLTTDRNLRDAMNIPLYQFYINETRVENNK